MKKISLISPENKPIGALFVGKNIKFVAIAQNKIARLKNFCKIASRSFSAII
jgi:hypothetical protein